MGRMTDQMKPAAAPVGAGLRAARLAAGFTIDHLAHEAGVGSATVARIEHGRVDKPRRATLLALALALPTPNDESPAANGALAKPREDDARHGRPV